MRAARANIATHTAVAAQPGDHCRCQSPQRTPSWPHRRTKTASSVVLFENENHTRAQMIFWLFVSVTSAVMFKNFMTFVSGRHRFVFVPRLNRERQRNILSALGCISSATCPLRSITMATDCVVGDVAPVGCNAAGEVIALYLSSQGERNCVFVLFCLFCFFFFLTSFAIQASSARFRHPLEV